MISADDVDGTNASATVYEEHHGEHENADEILESYQDNNDDA